MRLHSKHGRNNGEQQCIKHTQQAYDIAFDPKVENTQRAHRYTHVIPAKSSCESRGPAFMPFATVYLADDVKLRLKSNTLTSEPCSTEIGRAHV